MSSVLRSSLKLLIGIGIFVGLPLVGWGLDDAQGFLRDPARLSYAVAVVLLQVIIVLRLPEVGGRSRRGEKVASRERWALLPLQVIPLLIVVVAPYCDRRSIAVLGEAEVVRYLGVVLFCLGFTGMHWAEATLGRQFSVYVKVQEDHELVTRGLYRYIRHPRYLGIILFTVGFALTYRSWTALILVGVLAPFLAKRIRSEEALLRQELGTDWEAYSKKTWRLIPFVY